MNAAANPILRERAQKTHIEVEDFKLDRRELSLDEALNLTLSYRIVGELREAFTQQRIEAAYRVHDVDFRLTSTVNLCKHTALPPFIKRVKTLRLIRKALFYWSRDRTSESKIRVMVVDENRNPIIAENTGHLHQKMLNYTLQLTLLGMDLGIGEHELTAKIEASWGAHTFTREGKTRATTEPAKVFVKSATSL